MSDLVLVTDGTGLAGSRIALLALERGKRVRQWAKPAIDCSETTRALGYGPTPRPEAMRQTIAWLREVGNLPGAVRLA